MSRRRIKARWLWPAWRRLSWASRPSLSPELVRAFLSDPDVRVRWAMVSNTFLTESRAWNDGLLFNLMNNENDPEVLTAFAQNAWLTHDIFTAAFDHRRLRPALARNRDLGDYMVAKLMDDSRVRDETLVALADNTGVSLELVAPLMFHDQFEVRKAMWTARHRHPEVFDALVEEFGTLPVVNGGAR